MAECRKQERSCRNSIKYKWDGAEEASFELTDYVSQGDSSGVSTKCPKPESRKPGDESTTMLSTSELVSVFGQVWDCASRIAVTSTPKKGVDHKESTLSSLLTDDKMEISVDPGNVNEVCPPVKPKLEFHSVTQKLNAFKDLEGCSDPLAWRIIRGGVSKMHVLGRNDVHDSGVLYGLGCVYRWMGDMRIRELSCAPNMSRIDKSIECCIPAEELNTSGTYILGETSSVKDNVVPETAHFSSRLIECKDSSLPMDGKSLYDRTATTSLRSDYFLGSIQDNIEGSVSRACKSGICADYHINCSAVGDDKYVEFQCENNIKLLGERRERHENFISEDGNKLYSCSSAHGNSQFSLAKQEHAFAGALAGIVVSLCLHPVDTVKTVIQSCRAEQKSLSYIGRSIVSDRGFIGLYGGIASNIASSAPISAVYTFTYESVKGALLPLLSKEYSSFAHCVAGGCASVATSFIFTPSERIKQQMQVSLRYRNSWDAFLGIIGKGGLPSLYAGWGAVLCRNVPHSIIKFYMYENLKKLMSPSLELNAPPCTLQTLYCGGLAGSTAALFTTPFDVVKTRLQTQIPGSVNRYDNVFHALKEIGSHEGLNGLYRGLIPRLVMYMSQGALFFASYESFKRLFSLEVARSQSPETPG